MVSTNPVILQKGGVEINIQKCYSVNMKKSLNRFKNKPVTRLAWWGFGLGMAMILWVTLLNLFAAVIRPWLIRVNSPLASISFGMGMGFVLMLLALGALICCVTALFKGERSWAVWVGLFPVAMFLLMLIADFLAAG